MAGSYNIRAAKAVERMRVQRSVVTGSESMCPSEWVPEAGEPAVVIGMEGEVVACLYPNPSPLSPLRTHLKSAQTAERTPRRALGFTLYHTPPSAGSPRRLEPFLARTSRSDRHIPDQLNPRCRPSQNISLSSLVSSSLVDISSGTPFLAKQSPSPTSHQSAMAGATHETLFRR